MKPRKNPAVVDLVKSSLVTDLFGKAKDHVVKYYKKAGKKRRRNPEGEVLLSANEVAELTGGEFIPLKGIIVSDDSIQLITDPNGSVPEVLTNPNSAHYYSRKMSARAGARSATKRTGRTSIKNPRMGITGFYTLGAKAGKSSRGYTAKQKMAVKTNVFSAYFKDSHLPPSKRAAAKKQFTEGFRDGLS